MQRFFGSDKTNPIIETFTIFAEEKRINKYNFIQDLPYDENTIPTLSQAISSGLSNKDSLEKIRFNFLIDSNFLSKIGEETQITKETLRSITMVVYFNSMSFIYSDLKFLKALDSSIIYYLLNDLKLCLIEISVLNSNLRLETNAYFFHYVLKAIFSEEDVASKLLSIQNLRVIEEYLQEPYNKLDSTFSPIFIKVCKRIMDQPDNIDGIPSLKQLMIENLYQFLSEKKSFIDIEDCKSDIFRIIYPEIKKFNDTALRIFAWMSYNAKCEELTPTFVALPYDLIDHLLKLNIEKVPKFEPQQEFNFDFSSFVVNERKKEEKYTFIVNDKDLKCFPNGIEALPSIFFQKLEPLTNLFLPETQIIIDKLATLLRNSQKEFSLNFFNSFPETINFYKNSKIFPLLYAAYLILLKPYNITKNLLDSQKRGWMMDFIFNPKHLIFADNYYLCPLMNRFRNEVFDLLIYTDPESLIQMFNPESPFLYAEHLGRILSKVDFESVNFVEKVKEKAKEKEKKEKKENIDEMSINDRNMLVFQKLAENGKFCTDVIEVARKLQRINLTEHSKLISKMRNCVFLFTFNIARYKRFESKSFGPYFFDFLFESEITDVIIKIIEKYYIFYSNDHVKDDAVIGRILKALNICSERAESDMYSNLALKLTKMVHNIMHHNLNSIHYFSSLFDVILKNFIARPSFNLLNHILGIILFISMVNIDFCPKAIHLQKMADFIKEFKMKNHKNSENKNDRKLLYYRIMCLLMNSTQFTRDEKENKKHQLYLVKRPQFIPFLIASFGSTKKFSKIIKVFIDICKISWSNIIQCHRGCLDSILLMFLSQRKEKSTVFFGGLQIEMRASFIDQKVTILPLLFLMNSFVSSYSNASHYLDYCSPNSNEDSDVDEAIQNFMFALDANLKNQMHPFLMISSIQTSSIATGLTSSFSQDSFSICFFLRLDLISIAENEGEVILFDIRDSKSTSLACFIIGSRLFLRYDHNYVRTQVKLIDWPSYTFKESRKDPLISSSDWHFVNMTILENKKIRSMSVKTTIDFEKPAISEMSKISFNSDDKLTINFSKTKNRKELYCRYEYAFISQFRIFSRKLSKKERIQLALKNYNYVNDDIKLEIKAKQSKLIPKNLLRQFENSTLLFKFLNVFENNTSLQFFSCLRIIFESTTTQKNIPKVLFDQNSSYNDFTKRLSEILTEICFFSTKNKPKIGSKLTIQFYLVAYSIMEVITDECLRDRWLQDILLNLFIWSKVFNPNGNDEEKSYVDNEYLPFIINHWISVLYVNCTSLFKKNLCLMTILNQMDKLNIEHSKSNEYLLKFSVMVSLLNFDQFDTSFRNLYPQLHSIQMINFYLDILLKISSSIETSSHPAYYSLLYITFNSSDNPITLLKIIKIICLMEERSEKESINFNNNENAVYDEFLKLLALIEKKELNVIQTLFLLLYSNKEEKDYLSNNKFIYENSVLKDYPNLFSILIMISILLSSKCDEKSEFSNAPEKIVDVLHSMMEKKIKISTNGIWYIFPIILAFKTKDMTSILTFLSQNAGQSENSVRHIFYLLNLFEALQNNSSKDKDWNNFSPIDSVHYSFLSLLPHYGYQISNDYLELCLYNTFWHLDVVQPFQKLSILFKSVDDKGKKLELIGNKKASNNDNDDDSTDDDDDEKHAETEGGENDSKKGIHINLKRRNTYDESMSFTSEESMKVLQIKESNSTNKDEKNYNILDINDIQFKIGISPCKFEINSIKDLATDFFTEDKQYHFYYQVGNINLSSDSLFHWIQSNSKKLISDEYKKLVKFFYEKSECYFNDEEFTEKDNKFIDEIIERMKMKYQNSFNRTINSFFSRIKNKINEVDFYFQKYDLARFPKFNRVEYDIISNITLGKRRSSFAINYKSKNKIQNIQLDYKKSNYLSRFCPFKLKFSPFIDYSKNSSLTEQRPSNNKDVISSKKPIEKPQIKFFTQQKYKANWIRLYKEMTVIVQFEKKGLFFSDQDSKMEKVIKWQETTMIFQLSSTLVEFVVGDNKSYLFEFESPKITNTIISKIKDFFQDINQEQTKLKNKLNNNKQNVQSCQFEKLFNPSYLISERSTNFDYLIKLNYLNGRSFNLRNKYPIFPQFFDDFDSLKLKNIENYKFEEKYFEYYFFNAFTGSGDKFNINNYSKNDSAINFNLIDLNEVVHYFCVPPEFYILPEVIKNDEVNVVDKVNQKSEVVNNDTENDNRIDNEKSEVVNNDTENNNRIDNEKSASYSIEFSNSNEDDDELYEKEADGISDSIKAISRSYDGSDNIKNTDKKLVKLPHIEVTYSHNIKGTTANNATNNNYYGLTSNTENELKSSSLESANEHEPHSYDEDDEDEINNTTNTTNTNNCDNKKKIEAETKDGFVGSRWYSTKAEFCSKLLDFLESDKGFEYIRKWERIAFPTFTEMIISKIEQSMKKQKKLQLIDFSLTTESSSHMVKKSVSSQNDSNFLEGDDPISFISLSNFEYCIVVDSKGAIYFYQIPSACMNSKEERKFVVDVKNEPKLNIQFIAKYELKNFQKLTFIPFNNSKTMTLTSNSNFQYIFNKKYENYFVSNSAEPNDYVSVDKSTCSSDSGFSKFYCFASNRPILLAFDSIQMNLKIFDSKSVTDVPFFCQSLFNMSSNLFSLASTNEIFYCENESVIKTVFSDFTFYSEKEITYLVASSEFGIVVYSTIDGFVHIVSFCSNPQEINSIKIISSQKVGDLNDEILSISITNTFGYIVVHSTKAITVITVNGSIVHYKKPLETEIVALSSFTSDKGIDYIATVDEKHRINFFKASDVTFCLKDFECPKIKKSEVVSSIRYDILKRSFYVQTMSCKIFVFQHEISHQSEIENIINKRLENV